VGAKDTFTKYVFGFFESFRPRLTSKFAKSADMKKIFFKNAVRYSKTQKLMLIKNPLKLQKTHDSKKVITKKRPKN
jgi:hypothetical protein